ncbi:uncharacterized protein V5649_004827 [Rhynchonycteris naso]
MRQSLQVKTDRIRIVSASTDVDCEEQEGTYEQIDGKISQEFLENSSINVKGVELKEIRTLAKTDKYYRQQVQPKYKNWKKIPSQSQETGFSTAFNFDLKCETSVCSKYPQKYDTIDRRRKRKPMYIHFEDSERRQYNDRLETKTNFKTAYPNSENCNLCHVEKKQNYPVLHPYKNEFVVKNGTWTTNLESYDYDLPRCEKSSDLNQHVTDFIPLDILEDSTSSTSSDDDLDSPVSSDKQKGLLSPTCPPSSVYHIGDFPKEYYVANPAFLLQRVDCDTNTRDDLTGYPREEMSPSFEEPKEDYVDTMDEFQCFVETVSEYLAEKEEEINKYGSLSKTKKTPKHGSAIDNTGQKKPEDQIPPITIVKNDKAKATYFPELNGVKCAVGSLFSSLTEKVGSGTKHLTVCMEKLVSLDPEKTETLNQIETIDSRSGPRTKSVSEKDLSIQSPLFSQTVDNKDFGIHDKTSENEHTGSKTGSLSFQAATETLGRDSAPQSQGSIVKSIFSMLTPLKIFSEKDETKSDDKNKPRKEIFTGYSLESSEEEGTVGSDHSIVGLDKTNEDTTGLSRMPTSEDFLSSKAVNEPPNLAKSANKKDDIESLLERKPCIDLSPLPDEPKICAKDTPGHSSVAGSKTANKEPSSKPLEGDKVTGDDDFLEPLRKSFSQFLLTSPKNCSKETLPESRKIHELEEDGWGKVPKKDGHSFSFSGKLHIPFSRVLSHSEKQQDLREKGSIFSLFKFPFTDSHSTVNDQSSHGSEVTIDEEIQRNCHENTKFSSIKASSVPNIHYLGNFGDTKTFNKNDQKNCPEYATMNKIKSGSVLNINNALEEFGSIKELNSRDHIAEENYKRDTLVIPEVVPKQHVASDSSRESKIFIQETSLTVSDSSLTLTSTISKSTLVNEISEDKLVDKASKKRTQGGLLSGLFNRFSSLENFSSSQELNLKTDDSHHRNNTPSVLSGIFNLISNSSMTDYKPDEAKSMSIGDIKNLNGNKHLSFDEIPVTSCVTSEKQRNHVEKQETSGFVKSFSFLPKESTSLTDAWVDNHHCPSTWKNQHSEKHCSSSENSVLHCVPSAQQDLLERPFAKRQMPHNTLGANLCENSNKLNSSILNTNILNKSNHYQAFEEMNSPFCYEWDSDIKDFSKNSRILQPVYYVLNQNTFPSADVFLQPDSENPAINFCQKDQNANIFEWRTNSNNVIWCDLPYESFNQFVFNEDYLLRGNMWEANALYGNSCHIPINETKNSLEDLPIDLSSSSGYGKTTCPIVDQESLRMDENVVFSSADYEYQEWLSCLENGVWWPSEDGDYGYFMFHDGQYIYSLLTDSTGQYAYLFIPDCSFQEYLNCDLQTNDLSSITLDDSIISPCSFRVLDKEDELLWYVEEEPIDEPLDLSIVLPKSEEQRYLNLGTFSQILQESSYDERDQPLDFSVYNSQNFEGDFGVFEERPCVSEDFECTLDLKNQSQSIGNHILNKNQIIEEDKNQAVAKDSLVHLSNFHWLQSSEKDATLVNFENVTNSSQQTEEISLLNKVTSLFSALGAPVGSTLNFEKKESLESLTMHKKYQQSNLAEFTNDDLQSLILNKQSESKSQNEEESLHKKDSEKQVVSNVQQPEFTENTKQEFPLNKSIHVKKQSLLKSVFQVSQTTPQEKLSIEDDEIITANSVLIPLASQFSKDELKNCELPQDQSSKESERTLFKSALKLFGRVEDPSVSTTASEKQASGFLNLFKIQVNKEGSSNLEKSSDQNRKITSQENNGSPGISNIFGTLGNFFKTNISSTQTTENMSISSITNKDEVKSSSNPTKLTSQDVGKFPVAPVSSKGKVQVRTLNKQTTIDDGLKETSTKEIQVNNSTEKKIPSRHHLIQKSPNPSFSTNCLIESSREPSVETSGISAVTEVSRSNKVSFDILSRKNSNEHDHFSDKNLNFSTVTTSPSQPEFPTRKNIFSFLTASEKSENKTPATLPETKSQAEGLFTFPSFISTTDSSIKKDISHSSSFSFFSLSFLDEKQQTPGEKHGLSSVAPVISQPCKKPSVFVDTGGTMTGGSNGNSASIVQEVVHEQQMAPCVSISNTVEVTFLEDELNVRKDSQGQLEFSNGSGISLADFQMNQLQKDIVGHSPGFQTQTETPLIGQENLGVSSHKEDFMQEAFPSSSLVKSFSHDSHLVEKLNHLDSFTNHHQNEIISSDPLNLPLEKAPVEVFTQILDPTSSSAEPGCAGHAQNQDTDKEDGKSVLGSSVEMLSGFVTKVKSFSGSLIEPPKTFSGFFSSPKSPKKNSFFSLSSGVSSQPLKDELFGIFKTPKPEAGKLESSIPATAWLQNGSSGNAVESIPPENWWREVSSASFNSESSFSDCRMTVVSAKSDSEILTGDLKLTTELENNIPGNVPEPLGSETFGAASSLSGDDTRQGALSLSDEGDMGMLQGTDTEASFEAEHISLPPQLHPDPTCVAKELSSPIQPLLPLEPKPSFTKQDILELQATNILEANTTVLFNEASLFGQSATLETHSSLSHPLMEEPVLCTKKSYGLFDAQKVPPAAPPETEQPRPCFEIPNMTNWPKLHFPSSATDCGKPLSSFFSPPSSGNGAAETGFMSGFKKLSTLFEGGNEGKGSVVASDPKLRFGKKLGLLLPWPKENKAGSEQMPTESSSPVLVSNDQDLNFSEADIALESSQKSGASAEPAKVSTQFTVTSEQQEAKPSRCTDGLPGPGEVENLQEIPASGEDRATKGNLSGLTSPSGSHEEEHCTVSELLHQPETQEEEAVPASTDSVLNVQLPVTLHGIKEPRTSKRPVFN